MSPQPAPLHRRRFLLASASFGAVSLAALSGCAMQPSVFDIELAIKHLMLASADRAFAKLLAPGGFWDDELTRLNIPDRIGGKGGRFADRLLRSAAMRDHLWRLFNDMARDAARRAAPALAEAVHRIGIRNALELVKGPPQAATDYLHAEMGTYLSTLMIPEFDRLLRISNEPLLSEALVLLTGVDVGGIAQDLAREADTAIWREIGRSEAEIRANPGSTNDPMLRRLFAH